VDVDLVVARLAIIGGDEDGGHDTPVVIGTGLI
jgi:hypothetical protein